jgi:hypothetical protein
LIFSREEEAKVSTTAEDTHTVPEKIFGRMHVWSRPLQDFSSADRDRYLPLQPVLAAIGQCLLDYHHHPSSNVSA